jgi:hypothetical protein
MRVDRPAIEVKASILALMALGKVQIHAPNYATADLSGRCQCPIPMDMAGYLHRRMGADGCEVIEPNRILSVKLRCRRCSACLKERAWMWQSRGVREYEQASRTWFVTLTFTPTEHYKMLCQARERHTAKGIDFDKLPAAEKLTAFIGNDGEYGRALTVFLAAVRNPSKARREERVQFRYMVVPELHQSGSIHYHLLMHEIPGQLPLTKRRIEGAWDGGFTKVKLVRDVGAARYIAKYLSKTHLRGRLRASAHYGERETDPMVELAKQWLPIPKGGARPPQAIPQPGVARTPWRDGGAPEGGNPAPDDDAPDVYAPGDEHVCPLGLHEGVRCSCSAGSNGHDIVPDDIPRRRFGTRGVPYEEGPGRGVRGWPRGSRKVCEPVN